MLKKSSHPGIISKEVEIILKEGKKSKIPLNIEPMLATLVAETPAGENWIYEMKWDGYRAISYLYNGSVDICSRNNKSFNKKFYPIYDALQTWNMDVVLDGEIVVVNKHGIPDFSLLQQWRSEADGQLIYYIFDILWLNGINVMGLPIEKRREILKSIVPTNHPIFRLSEILKGDGAEAFRHANKLQLEGVMAKTSGSVYKTAVRTKDWLKIKTEKHQELVIGGYTKNEGTTKLFSALLLGIMENGKFNFVTPVGTGFNKIMQQEIIDKLKPYEIKHSAFSTVPEYNKPSRFRPNPPKATVTWVKPVIVAEISYREMTSSGAIRQPSFRGLREDKKASSVNWEKSENINELVKENKLIKEKVITAPKDAGRKTLLNPKDETQTRIIGSHELRFTNLSKIYWPAEKLSKRDMINYYYQVAPYMLPYMKERPQTLNRYPHGIKGESFYQKDVTGKVPDWIETHPYFSNREEKQKQFLVCTNEASLLYITSLGCIEMNPWSSKTATPDNPDWCIIDLDPDKNTFSQVIEAARVTREILDALEIPSFCKTSGSTGLHIYIPLGAKYTYEDSKEFARKIVKIVHKEIPSFTSIERKTADRSGNMYLDFLQNRPQATVAAPYSLRPKPGAPVSAPLHWDEVKPGLEIKDFNMLNMPGRLKSVGDLFKGVLGKGINTQKTLKKMDSLFAEVLNAY